MRSLSSKIGLYGASLLAISVCVGVAEARAETTPVVAAQDIAFSVPAGDLGPALTAFARQANQEIMFTSTMVSGRRTGGVRGRHAPADALQIILRGTGLEVASRDGSVVTLRLASNSTRSDAASLNQPVELAEILVEGRRSLNVDIPRTKDDVQPYVIFDAEEIERSQALTVGEFLNRRLTSNLSGELSNDPQTLRTRSEVNLRGLGQTLILIDGRRAPQQVLGGNFFQGDLNGIPISAIERIEVLSATAGAIYGADAVGGVVNVILRRDYSGAVVNLGYGDAFEGDASRFEANISGGFSLEGGRTRISLRAAHTSGESTLAGERDLGARIRAVFAERSGPELATTFPAPLGALPNIFSFSPLVLDNGTPLGSSIAHSPEGWITGADPSAFLATAGSYDLRPSTDLRGDRAFLTTVPQLESYSLNIRREFAPGVEVFADIAYRENNGTSRNGELPGIISIAGNAPTNPFQQRVYLSIPFPSVDNENTFESSTLTTAIGAVAQLPGGWRGALDYTNARDKARESRRTYLLQDSIYGAIASGLLDPFQDQNLNPLDLSAYMFPDHKESSRETKSEQIALRLGGPAFQAPGGPAALQLNLEGQRYVAEGVAGEEGASPYFVSYNSFPEQSSENVSATASLSVPLISSQNATPWARELELQVNLRTERHNLTTANSVTTALPDTPVVFNYSASEFSSNNYTVGLKYAPTEDVAFRASFGTGFAVPTLSQVTGSVNTYPGPIFFAGDPKRGGDFGPGLGDVNLPVTLVLDPDLGPETSESTSIGVIFTPRFLNGFRFSADYLLIDREGEVRGLPTQFWVDNEALYPNRVTRAPGPLTPDDIAAGYTARPIIRLDVSPINLASSRIEAIDYRIDQSFDAGRFGHWNFYAVATQMLAYEHQVTSDDPVIDEMGYVNSPLEWRGNFGFDWDAGPWSAGWNTQYFGEASIYSVNQGQGSRDYYLQMTGRDTWKSQLNHDLYVNYDFSQSSRWSGLQGTRLSLGVKNVTDEDPLVNGLRSFGFQNALGRQWMVRLRREF